MKTKEKEIADILNSLKDTDSIRTDIISYAAENDIVIVWSASYFLLEFRGAIDDELDAFGGRTIWIDKGGIVEDKSSETATSFVTAVYHKKGKYSWTFDTNISHETFDVDINKRKYCRGIIFSMDSLDQDKRGIWKKEVVKDKNGTERMLRTLEARQVTTLEDLLTETFKDVEIAYLRGAVDGYDICKKEKAKRKEERKRRNIKCKRR